MVRMAMNRTLSAWEAMERRLTAPLPAPTMDRVKFIAGPNHPLLGGVNTHTLLTVLP